MKSKTALYPGTFDPITYGHLDIIKRASKIFQKVIVAVAHNRAKGVMFSVAERSAMVKESVAGLSNIEVIDFDSLVVDLAHKVGVTVMVRGIRMISDFEYEFQMALTNRKLAEDIETIFLMPNESYSYISSKLIKEAAELGADVSNFIPGCAWDRLKTKIKKGR